ncbi:MAG: hypothetical protein Q9168_008142 [Polycauliona sp. 1 TL-2023]
MAKPITLFDLPSKPPNKSWSFNPWKARLVLNYKSIPYKTSWLDFPDIAPRLKTFGIPHNFKGTAYTVPTIRLPSSQADSSKDEYIMDSKAIANALEAKYPDRPLHFDASQVAKAEDLWGQMFKGLRGILGPKVMENILTKAGQEYISKKSQLEGAPVGDEAWEGVRPLLEGMGALLKEKDGPFIMGDTVSYADFVLVSGLHFAKRADEDVFQRWVKMEPACGKLYDASKQWFERDD